MNVTSPTRTFWNCFHDSYNANPKGINGKTRILSIIGESFTYKELIEELEVMYIRFLNIRKIYIIIILLYVI